MKKILTVLLIFGCTAILSKVSAYPLNERWTPINPNEQLQTPFRFYISSIYDERTGSDSVGTLLFSADQRSVTHKILLQTLTFKGIAMTLSNAAGRDTTLLPISIRIKECSVKETLSGSDRDRVTGVASLLLIFDLDKPGGSIPLTQYKTTAKYTRALTDLSTVDPTIKKQLTNSMTFLNGWIQTESPGNPKLAKGIQLTIRDYLDQHEDTVYYDPSRPLTWDDFREQRSDSRFAAAVFPSFGYDQHNRIEDGIIHVELLLKVYMVKSASWVGPGTRSNYNLKHEQKHFELVKLISERFKKKLLSEKLTPDNYQGIINFEYLEFYREMNKVQQEYDEQTSHGTSTVIQEFWNKKIDDELRLVEN